MNAHVKRQHPDMDKPKGFTRNLPNNGVGASLFTPTKTEGLYTDPTKWLHQSYYYPKRVKFFV